MINTVRWLALSLFCLTMLLGGWSYQRWLNGMLTQRASVKDAAIFDFENQDHDEATRVVATIANVDPLKGDMVVRLEINPADSLLAEDGTLAKEVRVYVNKVNGKAEFPFKKGESIGPIEYVTSLDGSTFQYPNDRYQACLDVSLSSEEPVPLEVEGYSTAGGFTVRKGELKDVFEEKLPEFDEGELRVVIGGRKCELALFTWLTAMLFALPPMRNAMVGVPSIGVYVDFLGFLCAEGLVACGLAALVLTWHFRKAT